MQIGGRKCMQIMFTKQCSSWNFYCECSILWTHHMVASCVCVRFDAVRAFLTWGPSNIHTKELTHALRDAYTLSYANIAIPSASWHLQHTLTWQVSAHQLVHAVELLPVFQTGRLRHRPIRCAHFGGVTRKGGGGGRVRTVGN